MVRNLVGTFVEAGCGRISPDAIPAILAARSAPPPAPPLPPVASSCVVADRISDHPRPTSRLLHRRLPRTPGTLTETLITLATASAQRRITRSGRPNRPSIAPSTGSTCTSRSSANGSWRWSASPPPPSPNGPAPPGSSSASSSSASPTFTSTPKATPSPRTSRPRHRSDAPDTLLLSAHLDTVFPAGTHCDPVEDGTRIFAPGACDNAAGLTALLAIAAALRYAAIMPPIPILFAANVGEEGEGDLRGMRHLFTSGPFRQPHRRRHRA